MSLFTCLAIIDDFHQNYAHDLELCEKLEAVRIQIIEADAQNNPFLLKPAILGLKEAINNRPTLGINLSSLATSYQSLVFRVGFKLDNIYFELKECLRLFEEPQPSLNLHSFQLPSIKAPRFSSLFFKDKYQEMRIFLKSVKNKANADYLYQFWQSFSNETLDEESSLNQKPQPYWFRYQAKCYMELRHGIQNQLALAYLCHKNKKRPMNFQADWRQGTSAQTGYGYVMSLALPKNGELTAKGSVFTMSMESDRFETYRLDKNKDQSDIKHNRITPLVVSNTEERADALLRLAKKNINRHLSIKLLSRGFYERYSYLHFKIKDKKKTILFCDPRHGLFQFEDEEEFLFFYEMLYAKEQMQTELCWNRYQVSYMRYAPSEKPMFTWTGKVRSFLTGLKYNTSLYDRAKNFVLFNITLFLFLSVSYTLTCAIAVISPFISTLLLGVLAQNIGSSYITLAFMFGSAGIFSAFDVIYAASLTLIDNAKSLMGLMPHNEAILHKPFELSMSHLSTHTSHEHLVDALGDRELPEVVECVNDLVEKVERQALLTDSNEQDVIEEGHLKHAF